MESLKPIAAISLFAFSVYCGCRLVAKTGNSGLLFLVMFIPVINVLVFFYLIFSEWPIERQLRLYSEKYGPIVDPKLGEDAREPVKCLRCDAIIPEGKAECLQCGWTYKNGEVKVDAEAKPVSPTPVADMFTDQRGF